MNMDTETIDKILELGKPNISTHEGLEFTDKPLTLIAPPTADIAMSSTLQGLVDLIDAQVEGITYITLGDYMLHVVSPKEVGLLKRATDKFGRRGIVAFTRFPQSIAPFKFGTWHDPENFLIGVQSGFQRTFLASADGGLVGDIDYVLKVASSISVEAATNNEDDGISQNVTMRQGIALKAAATLKGRVTLAPFRTFSEIDQVMSEFVFRVKTDGERALLALFEADGGRWQIKAAAAIAEWLKPKVGTIPIIQ